MNTSSLPRCVSAYGATFCLVTVMHKIVDEDQNICQSMYERCRFVHNDPQDAWAQQHRRYEVNPTKPSDTEPYLMGPTNGRR